MAVVAQGELVGDPFARNFKLHRRSENVPFPQQRQVRIAAALDEETGLMNFTPAKLAPKTIAYYGKKKGSVNIGSQHGRNISKPRRRSGLPSIKNQRICL